MTLPNFTTLSRDEALAFCLAGLQTKRAEIDATLRDLRSQLNGNAALERKRLGGSWTAEELKDAILSEPRKRRKMSAATRKRMAEAQRARWAKVRG